MSMYPCKICKNNNWRFEYTDGWIKSTCRVCNYEVNFEARKKNNPPKPECERSFACYEMREGKTFLKSNSTKNQFIEVGLRKYENGALKVVPISQSNFIPSI